MKTFDDLDQLIGRTPMLRLKKTEAAEETLAAVSAYGVKCAAFSADISNKEEARRLILKAMIEYISRIQ